MSLWGVILSLFQSTVVRGLRLPKDHIPGGINNADRLTVDLDFLVVFQGLEEICSRPFGLFYCFFCSGPHFPVLLAFFSFFLGKAL